MARQAVRLFMRVEFQDEICIGMARTMGDIPALLDAISAKMRAELRPDDLEMAPKMAAKPKISPDSPGG